MTSERGLMPREALDALDKCCVWMCHEDVGRHFEIAWDKYGETVRQLVLAHENRADLCATKSVVEMLHKLTIAANAAHKSAEGSFSEADFELHYSGFGEAMAALYVQTYAAEKLLAAIKSTDGGK